MFHKTDFQIRQCNFCLGDLTITANNDLLRNTEKNKMKTKGAIK